MTVCIANVAAKAKAIVMVSDKAVTYGDKDSIPLVSDTEARKFLRIGKTFWYALIAGDPSFAFEVVKSAERILAQRDELALSSTVSGMMDCLREAYQDCRQRAVEETVLKPRLFTRKLVVERPVSLQPLPEDVLIALTTLAKDFKTNCSLLVCGFDESREPHVFSVTNPSKCALHDMTGFFAVGIGATTALSRLLVLEAQKDDELDLALYQAFDAKVNAEVVEDVGYNWDAEILVPGREAIPVPPYAVQIIESLYRDFPLTPIVKGNKANPSQTTEKKNKEIHKKRLEKLSKFVDSVLKMATKPSPHRKSVPRKSKSKP